MDKNSKIVVFGAGGLIGNEIVNVLQKQGYNNVFACTHKSLELLNQNDVNTFFSENKPEYIFFCAVRTITNFEATGCIDGTEMYSNIMMQLNVMEAARKNGIKKAVFLGSAMLYPWNNEHDNELLQERFLDNFNMNEYRESMKSTVLSKFVSMKSCQYYNREYNVGYIYALPTHIYGQLTGRKNLYFLENLVINLCNAKLSNQSSIKLDIFGKGIAKKQILHVKDCANAIITIMDKYEDFSEPINIGTEQYESWGSIVDKICKIIDYKGEVIFNTEKKERLENRLCSIDKLKELGWKQSIDMETGLKSLCDEYMSSKRG